MIGACRSLAAMSLAVLIALTSAQVAAARGQATPAGTLVICRGLTLVTIHVDAEGRETESPHLCPEAALSLFATGFTESPDLLADPGVIRLVWSPFQRARVVRNGAVTRARGPPTVI